MRYPSSTEVLLRLREGRRFDIVFRRSTISLIACLIIAAIGLLHSEPLRASEKMIKEMSVLHHEQSVEIVVRLNCAARYLGHNTQENGKLIAIKVEPLSLCIGVDPIVQSAREAWGFSPTTQLIDVQYDGVGGIDAILKVRAKTSYDAIISQTQDFRQMSIILNFAAPEPEPEPEPKPEPEPVPAPAIIPGKIMPTITDSQSTGESRTDDLPMMQNPKAAEIAAEAKIAMAAGSYARAIALYTKLLQFAGHDQRETAQEYLGLARERNGQIAHAKAEYQRFLDAYPKSVAEPRVRQRLTVLLAQGHRSPKLTASQNKSSSSTWSSSKYISQYYRHYNNKFNDLDSVTTQSALVTNVDLTFRRRGKRFDFKSRLGTGYSADLLPDDEGPGNQSTVTAGYIDVVDNQHQLHTRIGRQSRNRGGLLGRFDGIHVGLPLNEKIDFNLVAGYPVNSSRDGFDSNRFFQGVSLDFGTYAKYWNYSVFYNTQTISGIEDRNAIGGEMRYSSRQSSFIGTLDYDIGYETVNNLYFQVSRRFDKGLNIRGFVKQSQAPFLTTRIAMIGQSVTDFDELLTSFSEDEIRQLALDRSADSTSSSIGFSKTLSPTAQFSSDVTFSSIGGTQATSGVPATSEYTRTFLNSSVIVSDTVRKGDLGVFSLGVADTTTANSISAALDYRYPINTSFKINPRIRTEIRSFPLKEDQTIYGAGIRLQKRWKKSTSLEFEVGGEVSDQQLELSTEERESYFVNFGYRFSY